VKPFLSLLDSSRSRDRRRSARGCVLHFIAALNRILIRIRLSRN
jgi:hypothetical protein